MGVAVAATLAAAAAVAAAANLSAAASAATAPSAGAGAGAGSSAQRPVRQSAVQANALINAVNAEPNAELAAASLAASLNSGATPTLYLLSPSEANRLKFAQAQSSRQNAVSQAAAGGGATSGSRGRVTGKQPTLNNSNVDLFCHTVTTDGVEYVVAGTINGSTTYAMRKHCATTPAEIDNAAYNTYVDRGQTIPIKKFFTGAHGMHYVQCVPQTTDRFAANSLASTFTEEENQTMRALRLIGGPVDYTWNHLIVPSNAANMTLHEMDTVMRGGLRQLMDFYHDDDTVLPDKYPQPARLHKVHVTIEPNPITAADVAVIRQIPAMDILCTEARRSTATPGKRSRSDFEL